MSADQTVRDRVRALVFTIQWAWRSHRKVPYRLTELWSRTGRAAHYRRWLATEAAEVRLALSALGAKAPETWSPVDLLALYGVLVDRDYDVDGFRPTPGSHVVDAGCGSGDFALIAAVSGPTSRVAAFDPNPDNVRHAQELLAANHLEDRVELRALALGDQDGTVRMGHLTTRTLSTDTNRAARDVPVRRLDSLELGPRVDLLKVDVEGMEAEVLAGAQEMLGRDRPRIIVEVHGKTMVKRVADLLGAQGYVRVAAGPKLPALRFNYIREEFWAPGPNHPA